jgi:hypothetical protein
MKWQLPFGFGQLDFEDWVQGLVSAFIGGGAAAVVSGVVVSVKDPDHYSIGGASFYQLVFAVFMASGLLNAMAFLRTKPIPDKLVEKTVEVTKTTGKPATVVTTVKETATVKSDVDIQQQ